MISKVFNLIVIVGIALTHFKTSNGARILAVFPAASISHQLPFRPLTQELAKRGHEVIVITTDPAFPKHKTPKNLKEIDIHDLSYDVWRQRIGAFGTGNKNDQFRSDGADMFSSVFEAGMKSPEVQQLISNNNETFDLILIEMCMRPALAFSHRFKAPVIYLSSFGGTPDVYDMIGAPINPIVYPTSAFLKVFDRTMLEKIFDWLTYFYYSDLYLHLADVETDMVRTYFGNDTPSLSELGKNVKMLFLNTFPIWESNRPVPPNVIFIGGIHQQPHKELPKDLQTYLDGSKNGVIYFSLGSNVMSSTLPPEMLQTFLSVFSKLPYDVLWKWDKSELPNKPANVRTEKWLPQSDLLKHPKIKLFVTQGGLQSIDEAIIAGVPVVVIPMMADQWYNAERLSQFELGLKLEFEDINETNLKNAIETVAGNIRYRENVKKFHDMLYDQPQSSLDRAIWWTEYVLRYGGSHLQAAGAHMSWLEYYNVDLILAVSVVVVIVALLSTCLGLKIWRCVNKSIHNDKIKKA